jgi:hypothetical protein
MTVSAESIRARIRTNHAVVIARHPLALRTCGTSFTAKWLLVDSAPERIFAPDLVAQQPPPHLVTLTIRDFIVAQTGNDDWPDEVESFPYKELARQRPLDFVRAYEAFRSLVQTGFTSQHLILIAASAVLRKNLFCLDDPLDALGLAFHSEERWRELAELFGPDEIESIQKHLRELPRPLGDLFGPRRQSARLATVALLVLSKHFAAPGPLLLLVSTALSPWQNADALELPQALPAWFEQEIAVFDNAISDTFLKTIESQLELAKQEKRRAFAAEHPISKKLRELVVFELDGGQQSGLEAELFDEPLEKLIPGFTAQALDLKTILGRCLGPSTRLRSKPPHQLKMAEFVQLFAQEGLHRLPLLIGRLRELQAKINRSPKTTPGFAELWQAKSSETDQRLNQAEGLLKDFERQTQLST